MKTTLKLFKGFFIGFLNSFLGGGGGIIAIPMFVKEGKSQNEAHANSIALMLLLTIISASVYLYNGEISVVDAIDFFPIGLIGSFFGASFMTKIPSNLLRNAFSVFMIFVGIKMIIK